MNTIFRIVICCLVISYSGATELFAQCGPNTLAFNGSQPIFNTACGNNSYQVINGSTPSGTGNTYRWEVSFSAATYTTIVNGSNVPVSSQDLSKSEITNFVLAPAGNASGDYRIRRIVTNTSASCTNTSEPVSLYYALSSSATTGGTIIGETLVCSPATGTLTVAGNTGPILRWESAPSSSGPWTPIPNSATRSYSYSGITSGTCYRALSDNICDGTAGSIDALDKYSSVICITVNSVPTITQQPLSQGACLGSGISLSVTATSATTISYQWRKNGFDINGANAATFSIASAVNSDAGSYDVVMTNSCGSVTSSAAVVTVNPVPVATVPPNSVVCPGTVIPITTFSSSPTGASFTWTNSNTAIGLAASGSGDLPSFTAANGTTSAITATITVTPVLNGCAGPASNYTITVNPTAVVTVPADFSVCEGATISATNFSSTPVGVTYTWTNSNTAIGLSAGSGSGNVPSFTALSSGSTTITVTPYVNGCAGTPSSYVIAVNQLPVVSASATDETSCSANNGTITITASGDATLEYSINGGLTYPSTVGNFTGLSPGSYAVMVRSSSTGCVVAGPILTVSSPNAPPKPVIDSSNSPVCEGETITVSVQTPIPNATYTWTGPGGYFLSEPTGTITRPNATIAMSGNYVVTVSVAGCVSDAEPFSIVVNRRPVVNQPPNLTYCAGASVPVSSFITTPAGATYSWTNTDPSIGLAVAGSGQISPFTAINNTNSPITATITVTPSLNNCDGVPVDFTITINPLPVIDPVANIIACHEATIPQQVFTSNIVDATFSWTISGLGASYSGSGSIPSFTAVNNGVSPIVGTVTVTANVNSCSGSSEVYTITVNPLPRLTNAPLNQTTCSGTSTTEVVLTSDVANADFSWTAVSSSTDIAGFTPNGIGNIPEELINNSGTVQGTVTYTIFATANGCTGPATSYVTRVNPLPRLRTTIPLSQTICSGSSSTAVNLSSETAGTSFTWTATASSGLVIGFDPSGSGDILPQTILNTGTSQGTVTYTITPNTSNCTGPISTYTITINPLPTATISGSATVCYGADAVLNVALTGTAPWSITYSDGISSFTSTGITTNSYSFNVSATSTKTYTIVSVTDALCSNSGAGSATISQPSAPLTATASSINVNCFGIYDGSITFTGVSGGSGSYEYSINGGVNWETGSSFAGLAPSTYSLQIRDLTDPACILVVNSALVITQPAAALTAGIASQTNVLCFGASTGSVNTSVSGGTAPYTYLWSNGSATANLSNVPAGTYTLNITDANGCAIGIVLSVTITQPGSALNAGLSSANVTCFGGSDGSITITNVSGGSGSYEYSINGGSGWQSGVVFNNLTAGTYQVLIRDASAPACMFTVNASLTISQPPQLNAAVTSNNVNCFGISDGSITFTGVSGGSGSYEYSINSGVNWQTGSSFAGLAPSTYSLQIRDLANPACRLILNSALVITQPSAPLSATISSQVNILCFGASTGSVNLAVTGGTAPYTYLWSNGFTSSNLTNVPAGSYTVNISDAQGCSLGTALQVTITQPSSALNATASSSNVSCFGGSNGSITMVNASGGSGTYEYSINGGTSWQSSALFSNLPAESYNVQVRDEASTSCIFIVDAARAITQPSAPLNAAATSSNVTCFGLSNGTIIFNGVSGGSGTYEYSINNGSSWQVSNSFNGLAPGSYNVQVRDRDNNSCIAIINTALLITQPSAPLSATISSQVNILCFGASTGSVNLAVTGGTAPYTYLWSNGFTSSNLSNVPAGSYTVSISDANGCSIGSPLPVTLTQPSAALNATASSSNVSCFGGSNGSITIVNASGGSSTYEYSINGGTSWQSSALFNNLPAASYNVHVRDAVSTSCIFIVDAARAITQPSAPLNAVAMSSNVTCFGSSNGSIIFNGVSGGSGSYQYSIDGGTNWQAGVTFNGLLPSTYNVQIRALANPVCITTVNAALVITQPSAPLNATISSKINIQCFGASTGSVNLTVTGGTGPYTYLWSNGSTSSNLTSVPAGSYTVNISDAQGCSLGTALQVTITQPSSDLNATASSSNVTCFGGSNGSITIVNASGGSSIYEYSINGGTTWQSSALFNNLPAAGYNLHVRDAAGTSCVFIINAALVINQPGALSATATSSNTSCFGSSDGTISVANMSGGSGTYEYSINNGSSWQGSSSFRGLIAGSYTVQVRDLINPACVFSIPGNLSIIQPALLSATVEAVNVSCRGANNGSIRVVNSTGGYGNFQFSINGGVSWQTLQVFNNLGPGIYNVQIRDALNPTCVQTLNSSVTIREAAEPLVSAITSQMNINCFGASTGSVLLFVRGGVAPYSYAWSNGSTSRDLTDVPAGIYTVNITDSYNCVSTQTISITQPVSTLNVSFSKKDVSCFGANNGSINISSAGGTAPYTYRWNDGRVTKDITNLTTALYTITVVDSKGCSISQEIRIDQPALTLSLELTKINVSCFGGGDGSVRSKVTGGTAPYTYNWSNGQKTSDVSGLPPGNYNVTIFDASGCTINQILTITQPAAALKASLTIKNTLCKTSSDGSITAIISGGTSPYKISWKGNAGTTNGISNLAAGIYDLTLTDANGCMLTVPAEVKAGICPPVAIDDQFKTYQDESLTGSAAPNDFDRENEPLSFSLALQPKNGKILFKADGTFTYTPNAGFWGIEIIPYRICNTSGVCSSAAIAIDVIPFTIVNLTPSISNVNEGRKISVTARLVKPYPEDVVIKLSYSGIAVKDLDYVLLDQFLQIIIPKGKLTTTQKITIAALTDNLQEGNEVLNIQIAATSHPEVRIGSGAMVIIGDIYPPAPIDPVESKEVPVNTDLKIDPLFSPNGDGQGNETFTIDNIVSFPDNEVVIFNRWGNEVFRIKGYNQSDRVFKGYANTGLLTNTNTPIVDGVYYYLITTRRTVNGEVVTALNKGYLILKR